MYLNLSYLASSYFVTNSIHHMGCVKSQQSRSFNFYPTFGYIVIISTQCRNFLTKSYLFFWFFGSVCFFFLRSRNRTMATGIWPRCLKANSRGKIPVAIPRFLLCWKRNLRHSIRCGLVIFMVLLSLFIPHFGNLVTVDSPRLPKSSGTDPKKALRFLLWKHTLLVPYKGIAYQVRIVF